MYQQMIARYQQTISLQNFYEKAQALFADKSEHGFFINCVKNLEKKVQEKIISKREITDIPFVCIQELPNRSGFQFSFPVLDNDYCYDKVHPQALNQIYILVAIIQETLVSHGMKKELLVYRGAVDVAQSNDLVQQGYLFCDEGGDESPSFIPHGFHTHLIQAYVLAKYLEEHPADFTLPEFFAYLVIPDNEKWVGLLDHVFNTPPTPLQNYHSKKIKQAMQQGTNCFKCPYYLHGFFLNPAAAGCFPALHKIHKLATFRLLREYQRRFNANPEHTKQLADFLGYDTGTFPLSVQKTAKLLEEMFITTGGPEQFYRCPPELEDYQKYADLFEKKSIVSTLSSHLTNPTKKEMDSWFPSQGGDNQMDAVRTLEEIVSALTPAAIKFLQRHSFFKPNCSFTDPNLVGKEKVVEEKRSSTCVKQQESFEPPEEQKSNERDKKKLLYSRV